MRFRAIARRTVAPAAGLALVAGLLTGVGAVQASAQPVTDDPTEPAAAASTEATAGGGVLVDTEGTGTGLWVVQLEEPSLAAYTGGTKGLAPTSPQVTGAERLDVESTASEAYLDHLATQQDAMVADIGEALDRSVDVAFEYRTVINGVAVEVSDDEAAELADLPGVAAVYRDVERELLTDVSHDIIGSPAIWSGETGADVGTRGEGVVVGIIDSGVNPSHPSFAATDSDGYTHTNPFGSGTYVGVCDPDHPDHEDICNDKLIGAWNFHPTAADAQDDDDHGSHVASTVAGNVHEATFTIDGDEFTRTIQGVAPHANVISYLVCSPSCPGTSSVAAVEQAIVDGVDVLNYSISGAVDPWADLVDRAFLEAFNAGVFVAAAAGNDGPGASTTAHVGPWNANVAATSMSRAFVNLLDVTGPAPVPAELTGLTVTPGDGPALETDVEGTIVDAHAVAPDNANACGAFPAGAFTGSLALVDRGVCPFADKVLSAVAAGATGVIVVNDVAGPPSAMGGLTSTSVPAVMVDLAGGTALRDFLAENADATVRISAETSMVFEDSWTDVVAGFSSRGPARYDVATPTFAAPGVNVLAAAAADGGDANQYTVIGGTSMASPHAAGSGALMAALHPDWSPAQILSALATTAHTEGVVKEDGVTPATPFDIGAGRLDLRDASTAGLVLDETHSNFLAADPRAGGDPTTLNVPFVMNGDCAGTCTFTRTVENVAGVEATYTADVTAPEGMTVTTTPETFTLVPGATQAVEITVDTAEAEAAKTAFGEVRFTTDATHENGLAIAAAHLPMVITPVAVEASIDVDPSRIDSNQGLDTVTSHTLTVGNSGNTDLEWALFSDDAALRSPRGPSTVVDTADQDAPSGDNALSGAPGSASSDGPAEVVIPERPTAEGDLTQTITHSESQAIVSGNSVACGPDDGVTTSDNAFLRTFTLADFGIHGDLDVTEVQFGIESVTAAAIDLTVNVYTMIDPDGALTYDNLNTIGTTTQTFQPQTMTMATVPVTATAPAGSTLVVEVSAPDHGGVGGFWPGSNNAGQSAPSYLRSEGCGMPEPADLAAIGFPGMHVVMNVTGTTEAPACAAPAELPWLDVSPTSGQIAPGASQDVEVTFDSTGLELGVHEANLCLSSNDPRRSLAVVPLTLEVAEQPAISVAPESLDLTQEVGAITEHPITIGNSGAGALNWEAFAEFSEGATTPLAGQATAVEPAAATQGQSEGGAAFNVDSNTPAASEADAEDSSAAKPTDEEQADATADESNRTLTHSASQEIVAGNSVACSPDGGATTTHNNYLRTFTLGDFGITGEFYVHEVAFGVENLTLSGITPTVKLYTLDGALAYANMTEIGTADVTLDAQSETVVEVPVRGTVPAGSTLVVEIVAPDLADAGALFIGSNGAGQTAPSYISAPGCGLSEPTETSEVGRPDMHIVMTVTGSTEKQACVSAQDVAWLSAAPASGTVNPGESGELSVVVDSSQLEPGTHTANLCIASNDPANPVVAVPVTLTVSEHVDPHQPAYTKLTADNGITNDGLGNAVAIDGDLAVVGAQYATVGETSSEGAAYVYARDGDSWTQVAVLGTGEEPDWGTNFGYTVAIDGDTIAVGANGLKVGDVRAGGVYVFVRDGDSWTQQAKLTIDTDQWGGDFGGSLALEGDTLLVGARYLHIGEENAQGAVYEFTRDGDQWTQTQEILASDGDAFDNFGYALDIDGTTAVATATGALVSQGWEGAAYVLEKTADGWVEQARLTADDAVYSQGLGRSVALDGDTVLVGSPNVDAAYVFGRADGEWSQLARLTGPVQSGDGFGATVGLDGQTAVVGAPSFGSVPGVDLEQGVAYVYSGSGRVWTREVTLTVWDSTKGDLLGSALAVDGDHVLVGAPGAAIGSQARQGAAYVFTPSQKAATPPQIGVTSDALTPTVAPGKTTTGTLTVANGGEQDLSWQIGGTGTDAAALIRPSGTASVSDTTPEAGKAESDMAWLGEEAPSTAEAAGRHSTAEVTDEDSTTLTHSASMDIVDGTMQACASNQDGTTRENRGLRTFALNDFGVTGDFEVSEVTFGVERLTTQADVTVNLYTQDETWLHYSSVTRVASETVTLEPQELSLVTVPVSVTVPAGSTLVMEVVTPDLVGEGRMFLGSNSAGETAPSYIASDPCGNPQPTPFSDLRLPHIHLVMAVNGVSVEPIACELPAWLAVDPSSGTVAGGEQAEIGVTFDAEGLEPGQYSAHLCITSNDPATPSVAVPVTLTVGDELELTAEARRVRNVWYADLAWTGAGTDQVDVYRDGELIETVDSGADGTGSYTDTLGKPAGGTFRAPATFTYQVCNTGAAPGDEGSVCSEPVTITLRGTPGKP